MGTRGAFGVRVDGTDRVTYNHFDSYPSGLGKAIAKDIAGQLSDVGGFEEWRAKGAALRAVQEGEKPTEEDIERLRDQANLGVGEQSVDDWYCLLRESQGHLANMLDLGVYIDNASFMLDSLFCEWAYVVNLDNGTLEVYRGFQTSRHNCGRYATMEREDTRSVKKEYYPVALIATFPLHKVMEATMEDLEAWQYYESDPEAWKVEHEGDDPPPPPEDMIQDPAIAFKRDEDDG